MVCRVQLVGLMGLITAAGVRLAEMRLPDMSERRAAVARELQDQHDPASTVNTSVDLLVENVQGCDCASISLLHAKLRVETPAASDDLGATADSVASRARRGRWWRRCGTRSRVYVPNLGSRPALAELGPRLTQATGTRSVVTFRLFTLKDMIRALSTHATATDAFSRGQGGGLGACCAHRDRGAGGAEGGAVGDGAEPTHDHRAGLRSGIQAIQHRSDPRPLNLAGFGGGSPSNPGRFSSRAATRPVPVRIGQPRDLPA
jgi:hypothetical protein